MRAIQAVRTLLLASVVSILPASSFAGVFVSITVAPPVLPVYAQPICPGDGYLWTPGYWSYAPAGYYWVPGAWVMAPQPGFLWTPGYWGLGGGYYAWHAGYWGPHVGFYGGVNYGYGYGGVGFYGGRWEGGHFAYNTAVLHVNTAMVHNTYVDRTVIRNTVVNRASFNGPGGINARPGPQEQAAMREQHVQATQAQMSHERTASSNRANFASANGGRPGNAAMNRPASPNMANRAPANNSRPAYNQASNARPQAAPANNSRPAYNQASNARPQAAPANNSRPAYNQASNARPQSAPANNAVARAPQPARQGGGAQPHAEPHQNGGGGGGEHEHR